MNLFNHVLALFCAKFVCNLEIRYPVLVGNYVRVVREEISRSVQFKGVSRLDLMTGSQLASRQNGTRVKHAGGAEGSRQLEHSRTKLPV